jgi:hypothetical protein
MVGALGSPGLGAGQDAARTASAVPCQARLRPSSPLALSVGGSSALPVVEGPWVGSGICPEAVTSSRVFLQGWRLLLDKKHAFFSSKINL